MLPGCTFFGTYGRGMHLLENNQVCEKMGYSNIDGCAFGAQLYSGGAHSIRIKVESKYDTFIGIISANIVTPTLDSNTLSTHGWWTGGGVVVNGKVEEKHRWTNNNHKENDIYELTIDCDQRCLRIMNQRTHMYCQPRLRKHFRVLNKPDDMNVDFLEAPHPWMLFIILRKGQVRLM